MQAQRSEPLARRAGVSAKREDRWQKWLPYLLVAPAMALMVGVLYPFFTGVYWSLTDYDLVATDQTKHFIGLANYASLLTDKEFWNSVRITLQYVLVTLGIELPLGLGIAMYLNRNFWGVRIFRSLLILPLMMPPIVGALMWKVMMGSDGVFNYLINAAGGPTIKWLNSPQWVLWSMNLIDIWIYTPFVTLILLAGLQSLPKEPYEASRVDGASAWFVFWNLTLPLVSPYLILVTVFRTIDCLKVFDIIYATTKGGPINSSMVLHVLAYNVGIRWTSFGKGMAVLILLWVLCYLISFYLTKAWRQSIQRASGL